MIETKKIEIEAYCDLEAIKLINRMIPSNSQIIRLQTYDSRDPSIMAYASSDTDTAFKEAEKKIPSDAKILEKKTIRMPQQKKIKVLALDEQSALSIAEYEYKKLELDKHKKQYPYSLSDVPSQIRLEEADSSVFGENYFPINYPTIHYNIKAKDVKLITSGKKGFFGITKKPSEYEVEIFINAQVIIKYKNKIKYTANVEIFAKEEFAIKNLLNDLFHYIQGNEYICPKCHEKVAEIGHITFKRKSYVNRCDDHESSTSIRFHCKKCRNLIYETPSLSGTMLSPEIKTLATLNITNLEALIKYFTCKKIQDIIEHDPHIHVNEIKHAITQIGWMKWPQGGLRDCGLRNIY